MTDSNIAIRLKLFIETRNLSYSRFADLCGIPRPSLSQILSGRNKKISDVLIGQLHKGFPDLNIMWLLFGEGNMVVDSSATGLHEEDNNDTVTPNDSRNSFSSGDGILADPGRYLASGSEDDCLAPISFSEEGGFGPSALEFPGNSQFSESDMRIFPDNQQASPKNSNIDPLSLHDFDHNSIKNEIVKLRLQTAQLSAEIEKLRSNPRKVNQITIYYDDSTFETFIPSDDR